MVTLKLKKLLLKPEIRAMLNSMAQGINVTIKLQDCQGVLLLGDENFSGEYQYPIQVEEQILGWVYGPEKSQIIANFLSLTATQEWEKKQLAIETLEKYEELNFLYNLSEQLSKCLAVDEVSNLAINELKNLISGDQITLILLNPQTGKVVKTFSLKEDADIQLELEIMKKIQETAKAEIINEVKSVYPSFQDDSNIDSLICAPLTIQNEIIGMISISNSEKISYTTEDLKIFTALTSQVAAAIQAAQYYETLKEYSDRLEQEVKKRTKDLEKARKKLEKIAITDKLTQLANRRQFDQYLLYEWQRSIREKLPLSLILCDVDYFKNYNDSYGHTMGDQCLKKVAKALKSQVKRSTDLVARYGGEEFAIILSKTDGEGAYKIAEEIRVAVESLEIPHRVSKISNYVTVSLGVATLIPKQNTRPIRLIRHADQKLYEAKANGRNYCC